MTLALQTVEPVRIGPVGLPALTLGWQILGWTNEYLCQPDGDEAGSPWVFTAEQARFVCWWYAVDERGRFLYRRGMLRRMKGWGKDPVGAALCAVELVGPCRFDGFDANGDPVAIPHSMPWVVTAAVSQDQTKNTMALFPSMFSSLAMDEFRIDLGKVIIYANGGRGLLEAVTSSPRALEGKRTTFALKNEPHHWLPNNDGLAMAEVIERNLVKARDGQARALSISNAHNPGENSDAEADYDAYLSSATGRGVDDFLYDSLETPSGLDISDPAQVRLGVLAARGDSSWLDIDRITATILDPRTREGESRRFYFNQVVAGDDVWLSRDSWDALAAPRSTLGWVAGSPPPGTAICLGFDGSDTDDWSAFRAETTDGYQFTPRFADGKPMVWNPAQHGGYIPRHEVNAAIDYLVKTYKVERAYCDPHMWQSEIDNWSAEYGDKVIFRWETSRTTQMAKALERFRTDVLQASIKHDGDPMTSRHIGNAQADRKPAGVVIRKDKQVSQNKIDLAMSSALAHEAALDATAAGWGRKRAGLTRVRGRSKSY